MYCSPDEGSIAAIVCGIFGISSLLTGVWCIWKYKAKYCEPDPSNVLVNCFNQGIFNCCGSRTSTSIGSPTSSSKGSASSLNEMSSAERNSSQRIKTEENKLKVGNVTTGNIKVQKGATFNQIGTQINFHGPVDNVNTARAPKLLKISQTICPCKISRLNKYFLK